MSRILKRALATSITALNESGISHPEAIITGTGTGCMENSEKFLIDLCRYGENCLKPTLFMQSTHKNMCFEYDTSMEAKKKLSTINAARRTKNETDIYDAYRIDKCVYIVRQEKKKGK